MLTEEHRGATDAWTMTYLRAAGYAVYFVALLYGVLEGMRPGDGARVLMTLAFAWAIAIYCALDARLHGRVFVRMYWVVTFMTWPVAPLVHLVRVRGKRGALKYLIHAPALVLTVFAGLELVRLARH